MHTVKEGEKGEKEEEGEDDHNSAKAEENKTVVDVAPVDDVALVDVE